MEGRRVGGHRRHVAVNRTQGRRQAVPAGAQRELLAAEVHTHGLLSVARQPQDHGGRPALPQDRGVPGATERRLVFLQRVGHGGAPPHFSVPVLSAAVRRLPFGSGLHLADLPTPGS